MGVNEGVVVPALRRTNTCLVEFTHGNNSVLALAINVVTVNIQLGSKCVVLLELLKLSKGCAHECRVNDADAGCGFSICTKCTSGGIGGGVVRNFFHIGDAISLTSEVNIAGNVRLFQAALRRVNDETLHNPGVSHGQDETCHNEHCGTHQRKAPTASEGGDDKQQSNQDRDDRENLETGDGCVDIGITGARDQTLVARHRGKLIKPDADCLKGNVDSCDHSQLNSCGLRHTKLTLSYGNGAIDIVGNQCGKTREQHNG